MTPKAVVFDIGNVLLEWKPDRLYARLIPDPAARAAFFARTGMEAVNLAVDAGAPFRETIYAHALAHPADADFIRAWHDRWIEMGSPLIDESWAILRSLKADGVPVFALSNFGAESFDYARSIYPEFDEFDRRYISGIMKVIKPDPEIYRRVEEDCGLRGHELAFFDDNPDNVAAALSAGWRAHVFTSPEAMRRDLAAMGISV